MIADSGAYNLVGTTLNHADVGAYVLTGSDVRFNRILIENGTLTLTGSIARFNRILIESGSYVFAGQVTALGEGIDAGLGEYTLAGVGLPYIYADAGALLLDSVGVDFIIGAGDAPKGTLVYFCILTGTTDIVLPMKSFQSKLRTGVPTYLQVVIPGIDWSSQIYERIDGTLKIDMAYIFNGEITNRSTIIEADLDSVSVHDGAKNKSIVLVGYSTIAHLNNSLVLRDASYMATLNGGMRYRLPVPNVYLRPGDTVTVGTDTFNANVISYYIGTDRSIMELAEA